MPERVSRTSASHSTLVSDHLTPLSHKRASSRATAASSSSTTRGRSASPSPAASPSAASGEASSGVPAASLAVGAAGGWPQRSHRSFHSQSASARVDSQSSRLYSASERSVSEVLASGPSGASSHELYAATDWSPLPTSVSRLGR